MTLPGLSIFVAAYLAGLLLLRKARMGLIGYLWGAFGFAAIIVLAGQIGGWNGPMGAVQATLLETAANFFGFGLRVMPDGALVVPDPTGWSILYIGIECSALIESAIFTGLLLFYPAMTSGERLGRLGIGLLLTFLLNLVRLAVIVIIINTLGKQYVPIAHAVVGRLVFFFGILFVYWQMLTMPTLSMVRRGMEVTHRNIL
jgi:exosortase family protein XrtG